MSRIGLLHDQHGPDTAEVTIRRMAYLLEANERRYRVLWRWAHDRLPGEQKTEFFNIVANGSPSTTGNYLDGSKPRTDGPRAVGWFTTAAGVSAAAGKTQPPSHAPASAPRCDPTKTECARCKNDISKCDGWFRALASAPQGEQEERDVVHFPLGPARAAKVAPRKQGEQGEMR